MDKQSQHFLRTWFFASIVFAVAIAGFNYTVDPYQLFGMPHIVGFNATKPAVDTQERLIKAYDVLRAKPNTVILGTSRVDLGLDEQHPAWPAQNLPVYNLGLVGGGPYTSFRYLQHLMAQHEPTLVVLGLDFEFFLTVPMAEHPTDPAFESRLAITREGNINMDQRWQRTRDFFQASLSLDALNDSATTLTTNFSSDSLALSTGNVPDASYRHIIAAMGSYGIFAMRNVNSFHLYPGRQTNQVVMTDVRAILDLCKSHNIPVILFINPVHADMLEVLDLLGYWQAFEKWKRELVALTTEYSGANGLSRVPLWDFTAYDSYSTEIVSMDRHLMRFFWDPSHYTRALGDVIIRRLFGRGDEHFGALLAADNIESHLNTIREQQHLYREDHQADVRRVRKLYDSIHGIRPQTTAMAQAH